MEGQRNLMGEEDGKTGGEGSEEVEVVWVERKREALKNGDMIQVKN